jgi:signal transduction histidine kinase
MIGPVTPLRWLMQAVRWMWLVAMGLVLALAQPQHAPVVLLGAWALLSTWQAISAASGGRHQPSRSWMLGLDLAAAVGLILLSGGWASPLWSGLVMLGVLGSLDGGPGYSLRLTSAGVVLAAAVLVIMGSPLVPSLLPAAAWAAVCLAGMAILIRPAGAARAAALSEAPASSADEQGSEADWVLASAEALSRSKDIPEVVEQTLDLVAAAAGGGSTCTAAVLLREGSVWRVQGARRLTSADRHVRIDQTAGVLAQALMTRMLAVTNSPQSDPGLASLNALRSCGQVACVPLEAETEVQGLLLVGMQYSADGQNESLSRLMAVGALTAEALRRAQRLRQVEAERDRLLQVQEDSRKRLARDLHDGPVQAVAALAMRLNYAGRLMGRDPEKARVELSISEDMARRATQDIRHMLFSLRPLILESQGLTPALWQLGKKIEETRGQRVAVEADLEAGKDLDPLHQSVIFYIAEEGLNNAVKHAQAQHVWIRLQPQAGMWLLEVEDDGVGFNVGAVDEDYAQRGSLGLVNMRERAALVGAQLVIESQEDRGTRLRLVIPRPGQSPDPTPSDQVTPSPT